MKRLLFSTVLLALPVVAFGREASGLPDPKGYEALGWFLAVCLGAIGAILLLVQLINAFMTLLERVKGKSPDFVSRGDFERKCAEYDGKFLQIAEQVKAQNEFSERRFAGIEAQIKAILESNEKNLLAVRREQHAQNEAAAERERRLGERITDSCQALDDKIDGVPDRVLTLINKAIALKASTV